MDQLAQARAFVRVAEEGNFSAAARSLKTTQPSVSKAIAELEARLETRLLHRTTRSLKLTEPGAVYYRRMKQLLDLWASAETEAVGGGARLEGRIRINAPGVLTRGMMMPAVHGFRERFPSVVVELVVDDRRIDPVQDATDIAIRIGALSDSTLRVRRVGTVKTSFYTTSAYLGEKQGQSHATGIMELELISFPNQRASAPVDAKLAAFDSKHFAFLWSKTITVSNALQAREAALGSAGVAILPDFLAADDLRAGRLMALPDEIGPPAMEVHMLHPYTRDLPQRVREFIDFSTGYWRETGVVRE